MQRLDTTLLVPKSPDYSIAQDHALLDSTLLGVAGDYKANTSRRYFTVSQHDLSARYKGAEEVVISTKYNGEGVFIFFDSTAEGVPGNPFTFCFNAPSGRVRVGLPCLSEFEQRLRDAGITKGLFVAELYVQSTAEGVLPTSADTVRCSFSESPSDHAQLALAVYDIIMIDGVDWRKNETQFDVTWHKMGELFHSGKGIHRVEGQLISESSVEGIFRDTVAKGEEGVVIRRLSRKEIVKVKPSLTIDGVIMGFVEDSFEGQYGVMSLLIGLTGATDHIIREFVRVGSGFSDRQRVDLLETLKPLQITAPLTKTDGDGRPINFVTPTLLVEVEGETLERETFSGSSNSTQTFTFIDGRYKYEGSHTLPRLTHATFGRFREDKDIASGGARVTQVISERENADFSFHEVTPESHELLQKEIFTKDYKGLVSIRKFLLLRTDGASRFPYVVYYLDASPTRKKDPFSVKLKGAHTRQRATELFTELVGANSGRGWKPALCGINLTDALSADASEEPTPNLRGTDLDL
jgi:hypothetical protein